MIRLLIRALGPALLAVVGAQTAGAEEAVHPIPTAADFGALPFITAPVLAPGGARYAARGVVRGKPAILVIDLSSGQSDLRSVGVSDQYSIEWYRWAGDNTLLVSVSFKTAFMGEEVRATRLVAYDVASRTSRFIGSAEEGIDGDNVLYVDPAGSHILLAAQRTIYEYPSVMRFDLATNHAKQVVDPRDNVWDWYADNTGVVRAGVGRDGDRWWVLYRSDAAGKFDTVIRRRFSTNNEDVDRFLPVAGTDKGFAIAAGKSGRFGLYNYDFRADKLGEQIYENATNDIDDFDLAPDGKVRSISYVDDRSRTAWLDADLKQVQAAIDAAAPHTVNRVVSISTDRERMIVWTGAASNPGAYYLFDRGDGRMHLLARPYAALIGKRLADMETVSYKARDGLAIPAYLTMPTTGGATTGLPLVIMPHGGPFARDQWGFDGWTQFLASKGYVVLQPNFRGSTGYGKGFVESGYGQWGRGMQNDIDDGVAWLAKRGVIDPKRVCILGASFGGYAAEWAAVRNPELYRCAISFAGVSDIAAQLKYDRKSFAAPRYFRDWRAKIQGTDGTTLDAISPARRAAEIKVPLLIAHGDADTNVPLNQSRRLVDALTKAGHSPEFHVYKGEGHGFTKAEDQIDFLKRVEAFLAKYNPA